MNDLRIGLERVTCSCDVSLPAGKFGLLANQASVNYQLQPAWELLNAAYPGQLGAIFSPQHGLWSEQQANMIESPHHRLADLNLMVHSLYSQTRRPSPQMLEGLEYLVIDLQDVGSRIYTFVWTMTHCLQACAAHDLPVFVLDRPNPLGAAPEGPILDDNHHSFVGLAPLPLKHDLTIGEVARFVNQQLAIAADLTVIPMLNWRPCQTWPSTSRVWVPTSPNLPTYNSLQVYPGQVLFEGTNVSEGRGTTSPFEMVGAPWIDGQKLARRLEKLTANKCCLRPICFLPTFDKWKGQTCGGVFLHPLADNFSAVDTTVMILAAIADLWPEEFQWLEPPYEYEYRRRPIDILFGNDSLRTVIDAKSCLEESIALLTAACSRGMDQWADASRNARLYER